MFITKNLCWISSHYSIIRYIFNHNCTCTNCHIITDSNITNHIDISTETNIISNLWSLCVFLADSSTM